MFLNVFTLSYFPADTSEAAACNPNPTSKNATLPAGCVIHGTSNNIVNVGECEPTRCLRNDSAFSNKTCEDQKFCCTVVEVTDVTVSCGSSVTFSVPKVARCGCQKCEEPKSQITGVVVGRNGMTEKPIAYCVLKFESFSYRADRNGFFSFEVYDGKQRLSVMFKDSFLAQYADLTKVFRIEKGQTLFSKVVLKPKPAPRLFNSSEDFKVQLGDNGGDSAFAEMEIPKDALLNDDGTIFSGQANLRLNVMDPRNFSDILTAPADFSTIDEDGEEQMLVSYGMLNLDIEDGRGNKLSPSKPIKLYLDPERLNISVDSNGNTTTKLWWLDAKTGRWMEAGDVWIGQKVSSRSKRAPTRFLLETEITPAVSRQSTFILTSEKISVRFELPLLWDQRLGYFARSLIRPLEGTLDIWKGLSTQCRLPVYPSGSTEGASCKERVPIQDSCDPYLRTVSLHLYRLRLFRTKTCKIRPMFSPLDLTLGRQVGAQYFLIMITMSNNAKLLF